MKASEDKEYVELRREHQMLMKGIIKNAEVKGEIEEEEWRLFKYGLFVSNMGRVKDFKGKVTYGKLQSHNNSWRYIYTFLGKNYLVHRMVGKCFHPNPDNLPQINHRNEQTWDNRACNLEWCDSKYNNNYGWGAARRGMVQGKKVLQLDKVTGEVIAEYESTMEVQRKLGFDNRHISDCCLGKLKTSKGYKWRYAE